MTQKTISTMERKPVSQIDKGTVVKKDGDMFIVSKISEAQFTSVVNDTLFGSGYSNSHQSYYPHGQASTRAVRNPSEAKYVLISFSTGLKFYPEFLTLQELLIRMTRAGFEVVNKLEIKEIN